jgi:hypothetical protein
MGIPHRHDLATTSCVNIEVQKFNRKLKKLMTHPHATILDISLDRKHFTTHGLHMNTTGKYKIAQIITKQIKDLTAKKKEENVISMAWKSESQSRHWEEEIYNGSTSNEAEEQHCTIMEGLHLRRVS